MDQYSDGDTDSLRTSIRSISPTPSTGSTVVIDEPPPYSSIAAEARAPPWTNTDPRSSSTQSLHPPSTELAKRRLLLIYIHGFMGDETSFQSFPAHLHNLLKVLVAESHHVHTKVYPKFRSKRALQIATDDFSSWLAPHENPDTDTILIGHSMGGLLASEVAMIPSSRPIALSPFRHRILGIINFDTPFLGIHVGVIKSGFSSLFNPRNELVKTPTHLSQIRGSEPPEYFPPEHLSPTENQDSNPNLSFPGEGILPIRQKWESAVQFVSKHSQNFTAATNQFVKSYAEFGTCLADYDGLKLRYCRIRMLEDEDVKRRRTVVADKREPPRVRFVNYYTASNGRPRQAKDQPKIEPWMKGRAETSYSEQDTAHITASQSNQRANEDNSDTESVSSLSSLSSLDSLEVPSTTSEPSTNSLSEPATHNSSEAPSSTTSLAPPEPVGPPPMPADYPNQREYVIALKKHWREIGQWGRNFQRYQDLIRRQRKLDSDRAKYARKAELDAAKDALRADFDSSPAQPRASCKSSKAAFKDERKRDIEALKTEHKLYAVEDKARRKQIKEAQDKARKAMKEGIKARKHEMKDIWKNERNRQKALRKSKSKKVDDDTTRSPNIATSPPVDPQRLVFEPANFGTHPEQQHQHQPASPLPASKSPNQQNAATSPTQSQRTNTTSTTSTSSTDPLSTISTTTKAPKERRFINLPPRDSNSQVDPAWQRIFMEGADEVSAHCGLFHPQSSMLAWKGVHADEDWCERYAGLVSDVAARVEGWVHDELNLRVVRGLGGLSV